MDAPNPLRQEGRSEGPRTRRTRARRLRSLGGPWIVPVLVLVVVILFGSGWVPRQPTELVVESTLLSRLQTLADGLHNEIVLCLRGSIRGDTAYATGFEMPRPRESTPMRSSFDPCPSGTLASWHNHPPTMRSRTVAAIPASATEKRARRLCVLSRIDIATANRLEYPFAIVSVDGHTWCWWTLEEIRRFAADSIAPGPPAPTRFASSADESNWSRPEGAGNGKD